MMQFLVSLLDCWLEKNIKQNTIMRIDTLKTSAFPTNYLYIVNEATQKRDPSYFFIKLCLFSFFLVGSPMPRIFFKYQVKSFEVS